MDPRIVRYHQNKNKYSSDYIDKYEIIKKVVPCTAKQNELMDELESDENYEY